MVTTNDKIILWWLTNRKQTKNFWLDTSLLITLMKKVKYPPKWFFTQVKTYLQKWQSSAVSYRNIKSNANTALRQLVMTVLNVLYIYTQKMFWCLIIFLN